MRRWPLGVSGSYAIECSSSAGGQRTSLKGPVQVLPASSRTSAENPPKTTETPRSRSHTIWWLSRAAARRKPGAGGRHKVGPSAADRVPLPGVGEDAHRVAEATLQDEAVVARVVHHARPDARGRRRRKRELRPALGDRVPLPGVPKDR